MSLSFNLGIKICTIGPVVKAANNVPSRTPSISVKPVKNKEMMTAELTKKISKKVFTKLKDFLTRGWNSLIKYSPGTIHTLAITDIDTARASSTVPNTTKTQLKT